MTRAPVDAEIDSESAEPARNGAAADGVVRLVRQAEQLRNPGSVVSFSSHAGVETRLGEYCECYQGIVTGDLARFVSKVWEVQSIDPDVWSLCRGAPIAVTPFHGCDDVLLWDSGKGRLHEYASATREKLHDMHESGNLAWGRLGVCVSRVGQLYLGLYCGAIFHNSVAAVVPRDEAHRPAVWEFCQSTEFVFSVRRLSPSLGITNGVLMKVPFDLAHWQKVAAQNYPNGLPEPQSDDPTQWLFHGHPAGRVPLTAEPNPHLATALQVAVARVAGYRWPAELDEKMRLAPEARAWVKRCADLDRFADDDGVVPLVAINKERPGAERVRELLEHAFGPKWTPGLLNDLLSATGAPGKSLDEWLRGGDFWSQHCAVFHHRPFVWQIWDGKKDGFNILVHYHRLAEGEGRGRKLLEKITYTYLGDWITQQQAGAKRGEAGADTRLKAAQDLQKKLELILAGEPPYDLFVRWKPLHEQPIGWNPDINDGVRLNIRPFVTAGVLRGRVNVKWTKDRGKEPQSIRPKAQFPWFWSCAEDEPPTDFMGGSKFTGERLNDLHYTSKVKQAARAEAPADSAPAKGGGRS